MATPGAVYVQTGSQSQSVKQEQSSSQQAEPAAQHQHMGSSVDTAWASYHGLPQFDDSFNSALANDHQSMTWPSSTDATPMTRQDHNYQLETNPDRMGSGNYPSISGWRAVSSTPVLLSHPALLSPAAHSGRPRTFPTLDVAPVLTGFNNTIAPHELYQTGPPRSEPYHYADDPELYTQQNVHESVEDGAPLQQGHFQYYGHHHEDSPSYRSTPFEEDTSLDEEEGFEGEKHEPYAKSLFRCLRDAPNHTMVLREIYDWFKTNTARGKDPHEKGWQNSIRHNLSMNKAFEKIEATTPDEPSKKGGYQWRLSELAIHDGRVQSTTRFRNKQPNKRGSKSHNPAPHRQASGAKGGRMARFAAETRRSDRLREAKQSLWQSHHDLRSRGIISSDVNTVLGHTATSMGIPFSSPAHPATSAGLGMIDAGLSESCPSSPYHHGIEQPTGPSSPFHQGFERQHIYDWSQHPQQYMPAPPTMISPHATHQQQHEPYITSSADAPTNTPAMTPEYSSIYWLSPTDRVFYDSSDATTPVEPGTPSSFGEAAMDPSVLTLGNFEGCQI